MEEAGREPVLVDLALQGGGSHRAFTWGVLDRLIEEPWLRIEAISGTSAGAMNAALLADGWTQGGAEGARAALDSYWRRVSQAAAFSPLQRSPLDRLMGRWTLDTSPAYLAMDLMARVVSPYDLNPLGLNPLRSILDESIDFDRLGRAPIRLFVTATSVRTGRGRIFRNKEITADVLLADGRIAGVGPDLAAPDAEVYDATGMIVAPGFIDMHVHLREPGFEHAETIETGARAAAAGVAA